MKKVEAKVGTRIISPNGIEWKILVRYSSDMILIKSSETEKVVVLSGGQFRYWTVKEGKNEGD